MKTTTGKSVKKPKPHSTKTLRELLLEGPVMTKEQYAEYKAMRKKYSYLPTRTAMKTKTRKSIIRPKLTNKDLLSLVLNGPVMTKEKYAEYKAMRKQYSKWNAK